MKNRIKKFYKDHEDFVLGTCAGVILFGVITAVGNNKGKDIERVGRFVHDDGTMDVRVVLRNSNERVYRWNADK